MYVDGCENPTVKEPQMFKITHHEPIEDEGCRTEYEKIKGFGDIVKFPRNIGITGEAIQKRKVIVVQKGERVQNYASEIDNVEGVSSVESFMVGPVFDNNGNLRGVIQFVNKCSDEQIIT